MRLLLIILLAFAAAPVSAQHATDRFSTTTRLKPLPAVAQEAGSPITTAKVVGAIGGTVAGGFVGLAAGLLVSGSGEDIGAGLVGGLIGATAGAGLGAYIPGDSPPGALTVTLAMATLGTVVGVGIATFAPPLTIAGPPAGALLGFSLAY